MSAEVTVSIQSFQRPTSSIFGPTGCTVTQYTWSVEGPKFSCAGQSSTLFGARWAVRRVLRICRKCPREALEATK